MPYDYQWEERWIRDAGYSEIVPPTILQCLEKANRQAAEVTHFCMPATLARVAASVVAVIVRILPPPRAVRGEARCRQETERWK